MNVKQQKLLNRLESVLDAISECPATSAEATVLFEDFVITFEEIANDLKTTSDKETANTLRMIVRAANWS